jgi:hypothetical protein
VGDSPGHKGDRGQTERRFDLVELDSFPYETPAEMQHFVNRLKGIEDHLRLMKAKPGMLTAGLCFLCGFSRSAAAGRCAAGSM